MWFYVYLDLSFKTILVNIWHEYVGKYKIINKISKKKKEKKTMHGKSKYKNNLKYFHQYECCHCMIASMTRAPATIQIKKYIFDL